MPTMLPPLHAQLVLSDGEGRDWQSRVEAIDPYALTVARPFDLPLDGGPTTGSPLELTWGSDGGSFSLPVELAETVRDGHVALWVVTPKGEATRSQRRAHFRLDLDGDVALTVQDEAFDGHLVDVSEAGLRVRLTPQDARAFRPGSPVTAAFEIRQERFGVAGRVLRSWPSARANGDDATDVVLVLELPEPQARDLRRAMMAEQVQRRRLARD
ncbi:PilZ domain-containing protein [Nocardioides sp. CER19]|uniref:PilZ domain-containing protein n=1 Tax=Nocardioides sp. CER19 TaxID=3038538 RepID=UPI00244C6E5B|nr:PilZ domain-containing protein [Nocardioides sp. CER19]MDH2414872.1 PilZ domain-containing protein [Nocardioides sp. CER19]